jgi:excisionase family DNA binding protein
MQKLTSTPSVLDLKTNEQDETRPILDETCRKSHKDKVQVAPIAVSVSEAAKMLSLSRSTGYNLVKSGLLPFVQIGGRKVVLIKDLIEFTEKSRIL